MQANVLHAGDDEQDAVGVDVMHSRDQHVEAADGAVGAVHEGAPLGAGPAKRAQRGYQQHGEPHQLWQKQRPHLQLHAPHGGQKVVDQELDKNNELAD